MASIQEYNILLGRSIDNVMLFIGGYTGDLSDTVIDLDWAQFELSTSAHGYTFVLAENIPCESIYYRKKYTSGDLSKKELLPESRRLVLSGDVEAVYIMLYKYSPTFDGPFIFQTRDATPYYKTCQVNYKKENEQIFLRKGLSAGFSLHGEDFDFIAGANSLDCQFRLIFYLKSNSVKSYLEAYFYKTDCSFDYTKKKCVPSELQVFDQYTKILENYSKEYDVLQLKTTPSITAINTKVRGIQQVYISGEAQVTNFMNGVYWEEPVSAIQESYKDLVHKYHFALSKVFMEITFEDSPIVDANGVYTGEFKYDLAKLEEDVEYTDTYELIGYRFTNQKGYYIELGYSEMGNYPIYLKNPQGDILYAAAFMGQGSNITPAFFLNTSFTPNISDAGPLKASSSFRYHIYKRLLCAVDKIGEQPLYDVPLEDFASASRNLKKCIGSPLDIGLTIFMSNVSQREPTKYGKNELGFYYKAGLSATSGLSGKICPIARSSWANASLWFAFDFANPQALSYERATMAEYTIKDTWRIDAVIKALLDTIAPNITHEASAEYSQFLYARQELGIFPEIAPFEVFIAPKSNVTHLNYDQPAQTASLTFESLMQMLRDCFQCYWYIDSANRLRIEHISYFKKGYTYADDTALSSAAVDLRTKVDAFNKKSALYAQSSLEFEKDKLFSRYEFSNWMDKSSFAFEGLTIDVNSKYINKSAVLTVGSSNFSTDIDLMYSGASSFSDEGFALLCAQKSERGDYYLPFAQAQINDGEYSPTIYAQNWYASWLYLAKLYMYDMPSKNITVNKVKNLIVRDLKDFGKSSVSVWAKDPESLIDRGVLTDIGLGRVVEVSRDIHTGLCKVGLLHRLK